MTQASKLFCYQSLLHPQNFYLNHFFLKSNYFVFPLKYRVCKSLRSNSTAQSLVVLNLNLNVCMAF